MPQAKIKPIQRLAFTALFTAFSAIISLAESIIIPQGLFLPGVKIGLGNLAVLCALYLVDARCAFWTAAIRPIIMFLFSGNAFSLAMSLCGSLLSLISLLFTKKLYGKCISFIGVCAVSAVFHSLGQTIAGMLLTSADAFFVYFPLFAAASCIAGDICGAVMNAVFPRLKKSAESAKVQENLL